MSASKRLLDQTNENESFSLPSTTINRPAEHVCPIPSPDSTRLAYAVVDHSGVHVEVSGQNSPSYSHVSGITFGTDSRVAAYVAGRKGLFGSVNWFVVFNGKEYQSWDDIGKSTPEISPDSSHVAYTAKKGSEWFAVRDEKTLGGPYEGFSPGGVVFSSDSQHLLYVIKTGEGWRAVVDGKEQASFPTIMLRTWNFSPDSSNVVYIAGIKGTSNGRVFVGEQAVVIDGQPQRTWPTDGQRTGLHEYVAFSPNSRRTAYAVARHENSLIVIDGIPQKPYPGRVQGRSRKSWETYPPAQKASWKPTTVAFSPDSLHFAYAVGDAMSGTVLVYDGSDLARHYAILAGHIAISPDNKHLAYGAQDKSGRQFMVVDGQPQALSYTDLAGLVYPRFSPDSEHVAYVVSHGRDFYLVVDSEACVMPGGPVLGSQLVWDDPKRLHTLVGKGAQVTVARFELN